MNENNRPDFQIGDWVTVARVAERTFTPDESIPRRWTGKIRERVGFASRDLVTPVVGQVVGYRYRHAGVWVDPVYGGDDYEPGHIVDREAVLVAEVRVSMTNKPLDVLPGDLERTEAAVMPWRLGEIPKRAREKQPA